MNPLYITVPLMVLCVLIFLLVMWRERQYKPGRISLIPPVYIQITVLILFVVLAGNLVVTVTGVEWTSPFSRR